MTHLHIHLTKRPLYHPLRHVQDAETLESWKAKASKLPGFARFDTAQKSGQAPHGSYKTTVHALNKEGKSIAHFSPAYGSSSLDAKPDDLLRQAKALRERASKLQGKGGANSDVRELQQKAKALEDQAKEADIPLSRLKAHKLWEELDYSDLKRKGYSNKEILAFWDRDLGQGHQVGQKGTNKPWIKDAHAHYTDFAKWKAAVLAKYPNATFSGKPEGMVTARKGGMDLIGSWTSGQGSTTQGTGTVQDAGGTPKFRQAVNQLFASRKIVGKHGKADIREQPSPAGGKEYFADFPDGRVAGPFGSVVQLKARVQDAKHIGTTEGVEKLRKLKSTLKIELLITAWPEGYNIQVPQKDGGQTFNEKSYEAAEATIRRLARVQKSIFGKDAQLKARVQDAKPRDDKYTSSIERMFRQKFPKAKSIRVTPVPAQEGFDVLVDGVLWKQRSGSDDDTLDFSNKGNTIHFAIPTSWFDADSSESEAKEHLKSIGLSGVGLERAFNRALAGFSPNVKPPMNALQRVKAWHPDVHKRRAKYPDAARPGARDATRDAGRLMHVVTRGTATVKVYWNPEYKEYTARLFKSGKLYEPADYFTDALDDAKSTAEDMAKRADTSKPKDAAERFTAENARYAARQWAFRLDMFNSWVIGTLEIKRGTPEYNRAKEMFRQEVLKLVKRGDTNGVTPNWAKQ